MAHDQEKLISQPVGWSEEAESILAHAVTGGGTENIGRQIAAGAQLFRLTHGNALIGYYVLRVDHLATHSEGVFVAGAGRHPDIDLTATALPIIERQFIGCEYIRIHTARAGLVKKLAGIGYEPLEFVMRKKLAHV